MVSQTDVLVESFSPRVMSSLGLSYESLAEANPGLVMVSISNFGQTGPYRDFKASEMVLYGMGGAMHSRGLPGREPVKYGTNVVLYQAGLIGALAAMTGLFRQAQEGRRRRARGRFLSLRQRPTAETGAPRTSSRPSS